MIIEKIAESRFNDSVFESTVFGKEFSDHMLIAHYKDGKWGEATIKPYGPITMTPAAMSFHYGQTIFEGMKAYKNENDDVFIFRPEKNFERFNLSAARLNMPQIPKEIFIDGLKAIVDIDRQWVPQDYGTSLYIRPVMFATEEAVSARSSNEYIFAILLAYAPSYYEKPLSVKIADFYSRAAQGGVGFAKCGGNYAASFFPASEVQKEGYDQIIWTDSIEHKYIEEAGTMNVMVRIGNKLLTAPTSERILNGVTRDSVLTLAKDAGYDLEIRPVEVKELYDAYKSGELKEVFGCGTAVVITQYDTIGFGDERVQLPHLAEEDSFALNLKKKLKDIQYGLVEDPHGWRVKIEKEN
ncbi:branched-chain amino acid aminotransferase [Chishuiella changwenlii]|jgi:branched-chain amino acid aminotransferase|uniref:branched-chain amino acid aminotransferase n=1 Tax=Chishuiella changwenlii TaxID=1434701 RepID=UPI002FDA4A40